MAKNKAAKNTGKGNIMSTKNMKPTARDKQPQAEKPAENDAKDSVKKIAGKKPSVGAIEWRGKRFETTRVELERCYLHVRTAHHDGKLGKLLEGDVYDAPVRDADRLINDWPKKFEVVPKKKAEKIREDAHDKNWDKNLKTIKRRKAMKVAHDRRIKAILGSKSTK